MTREEWIERFAASAGVAAPTTREMDELLKLAGVAAHSSERPAAPIACWIAARSELALSELLEAAQEITGE